MFYDVHCHLDISGDTEKVIKNAESHRVRILTNGGRIKSNRDSLNIKENYPNIGVALGLYPLDSLEMEDKEISEEINFIKQNRRKIMGVGEVGMDFKEISEEKERQKKTFGKFIELAIEIDKPIFVHSRKAELDCIEILEKEKAKKVVMHCFSGNLKLVKRIIDNGWFLSIPTSVIRSEHFQRVIEMTPITQLLCETDSPFLHPRKEWPNEPANVIESYKKIAEIKNLSLEDVEKSLEKNIVSLFGKWI